jgi:hypothetical protein
MPKRFTTSFDITIEIMLNKKVLILIKIYLAGNFRMWGIVSISHSKASTELTPINKRT